MIFNCILAPYGASLDALDHSRYNQTIFGKLNRIFDTITITSSKAKKKIQIYQVMVYNLKCPVFREFIFLYNKFNIFGVKKHATIAACVFML
jgi:hypothetical protein